MQAAAVLMAHFIPVRIPALRATYISPELAGYQCRPLACFGHLPVTDGHGWCEK